MNLLELQTRANALVQKVNEYEETIAGVELDENEILNEHTYVDLFSLRMIMHRLFGTTPSDRSSNLTTTDGINWYYIPVSKACYFFAGTIQEQQYIVTNTSTPKSVTNNNNDLYSNYNLQIIDPNRSYAYHNIPYTNASANGVKQMIITSMGDTVFGADIRDALVTESQTANIFKWNTTSEDDTTSYASTYVVPQQVPGIVCYYLGSGYDGTYTATVPYNINYSTNQPNNATPALYGAYYIDQNVGPGPSGITSQQAENRGAEGLRMFMPGLTYFNGTSISPINIWQPFPRLDTDYGYNYQGKALYHELVFKRRRAGCQAAGLDFIPDATVDNDMCDNDPQGLAMRLALAQQKPYYYNRPWFKELDEYYTTEGTKQAQLADKIIEKMSQETYPYDLSDWNFVGNPDVDYETAVVTNLQGNNISYATKQLDLSGVTGTLTDIDIEFTMKFNDTTAVNTSTYLFSINKLFRIRLSNNKSTNSIYIGISYYYKENSTSSVSCTYSTTVDLTKVYSFKITRVSGGVATFFMKDDNGEFQQIGTDAFSRVPGNYNTDNILKIAYHSGGVTTENFYAVPYFDLSDFKITLNNQQIVVPPTKSDTPVIKTMTDNEFYNNYQLDYNTYAEALDEPL